MFIYLSKKIAIPNNTKIKALAWNKQEGYIAVGGENGLLKILKLESNDKEPNNKSRSLAATSNLSMNQTLEGHTDNIRALVWNESHKKLTTSDESGVIIVWMLYKGAWYEEMINNRKKSTVVGMAWSSDGQKICIIYEDGAVIVGCVGGNRIWGKELKNVQLSGVQWSPDGKLLLFSLKTGHVHLYDNQGNFVMQINLVCLDTNFESAIIVAVDWYNGINGYMYAFCPNLAIVFENGKAQIMRNESDINPVVLDTRMFVVHCSWNHNGSLLAISGKLFLDEKEVNLVQFYNPFGQHVRTLKVPGNSINCCVWEGGSLRVALAVDSFVYFANIRPDYKWCYFKKTIVFSHCKPPKPGICLSFWDTSNGQVYTRWVSVLLAIAAYGDYCIIATRSNSDATLGEYSLLLYNTLGTAVDGKYIDIEPIAVAINKFQVVAASKNNFIVWQYKSPKSITGAARCKIFHIDDSPMGATEIIQDLDSNTNISVSMHNTIDPICCIATSDKCLIIGRESGLIQCYALPHVVLTNRFKTSTRPQKLSINCNSTRLALIDVGGLLAVLDISENVGGPKTAVTGNKLERKDVWAMCWALDNPQLLAIMEKTRMYIFKGIYPEEPIACSGYICRFSDLEIAAVLLDEVMDNPDKPSREQIIKLEIKSLRDTKELLEKVGISEAYQFVEDNRHPRLWRLVAEAALKQMDLSNANICFVRSRDYTKVMFVKKLADIKNEAIRHARVAAYFKNVDEAERIYLEADRSDMALNLRKILGDWFRVIQILKNGVSAPDYLLKVAYNSAADYFAHFNNWISAIEYYELCKNLSAIIECYCNLEDWKSLEEMIDTLPEKDGLLEVIGDIFAANAVHNEAVRAYVKFGKIRSAINLCILYNRWDVAIDLDKRFNISKISDLLTKYTTHLVEQGQIMKAIEMNVQAKYYIPAAEHAFRLAKTESQKPSSNLMKVKKYYVYAAKLVELYKKYTSNDWQPINDSMLIELSWKGAEAYHYYILAHRYLYSGKLHDALCVACKLQEYEDWIPEQDIYAFLAFTACLDRSFAICSKALMKLKMLPEISATELAQYTKLEWEIFRQNEPVNVKKKFVKCDNCDNTIQDWNTVCPKCKIHFPTCVASGKAIIGEEIWFCVDCRHPAIENKMSFQSICPLCHSKNEQ